ncbi:hypothetical protein FLBR109950_14395 [Flavobacterium branchiophilum]|uniref:Glucosamine inositolphosphorylceramide transferase 1 N-terminal domain-containing protein n=1 Tax=Flavobacterium branchiophilum (strain FL-15) TaxID=1034807 RepID=G2Z108_FLABF|nr:hypothetical protein [Flavobacterium branchiophilum]CCB69561.1 Hypothetical protein FBFL15_1496 [Flavobacterium branchiophilum FL-15]
MKIYQNIKYIIAFLVTLFIIIFSLIDKPNIYLDKNVSGWQVGIGKINSLNNIYPIIGKKLLKNEIKSNMSFDFIADPFIYKDKSGIYVFVEHVYKENGDISVFYSKDTVNVKFKYLGVALDEPFHLSYPQVFVYKNQIYMLPETQKSGSVILYKSENFPLKWKKERVILPFNNIKDPTLLQKNNKLYLFGCQNDRLYCWFSNDLHGNFKKIEKPIIMGTESRPGGRIIQYDNKIIFPIQNNTNGYGTGLSLYELKIDFDNHIDMKEYKKWFLKPQKNIKAFTHGMHHLDVVNLNNQYFVVYDGNAKNNNEKVFNYKHFIKYSYLNFLNILY